MTDPMPVALGAKFGQHDRVKHVAVAEALRRGVPLRVVHVSSNARASRALFDEVKRIVATRPSLDADYVVLEGHPTDALLQEALVSSVMVLGADDPPWLSRRAGTGISQVVATDSRSPVVVVPRTRLRTRHPIGVVAALDSAHPTEGPLIYALQTAHRQRELLHVVSAAGVTKDRRSLLARQARLEQAVAPWMSRFPAVEVRLSVEVGLPVHLCLVWSVRASVLVLGQPVQGHPHLASHAAVSRLLRRSNAPIAVIPPHYRGV